jgi:predicted nuclease with TOPRIM domain
MAEDVASLTYGLLKRMNGQLARLSDDMEDVKGRLSAMETGQALLRQETALLSVQVAQLNHRMDRFDERLSRIERRLDLIEA